MSSGEIYWQNEMLPQQPNQQTHGDVSRQTLLSTLDTVVDSLIHSRQALRLPPHAHRTSRVQKADSRRSTSEHQRLLLTHADQQRLLEMIKNAITPYYQRPAAAAAATSTVPPAMAPSLSGGPSRFERGPHADECRAKQIPVQPDPSCFCGGPNRPSPGADMPNWETEKGRAKARDARVPRQYDRHGAVTAWNRYYERPRPGGYARDGGGAMAAVQLPPQQPPVNPSDNLFYGAVEVEANVAIAVKNLLKARTCMRNVHFAVGSLFPASATYTDDIGKMQQQLKAFNTQFRYLNTKVNEVGEALGWPSSSCRPCRWWSAVGLRKAAEPDAQPPAVVRTYPLTSRYLNPLAITQSMDLFPPLLDHLLLRVAPNPEKWPS
ncbi:unnamed protein product, partial [Mesorhabditis spiculigera]